MVKTDDEGLAKLGVKIPEEWFEQKEELDCSWREIIGLGIKAKKDNPQLIQRIKNLEQKTEENQRNYITKT